MRISNIFICLLISCLCAPLFCGKCERNKTTNLRTYKIDLDKHPSERFHEVLTDFKPQVVAWVNKEKAGLNSTYFPLIELIAGKVDDYIPYPFNEELKGMAKSLNISVGDAVLFNIVYDLTAFCTGIMASDKNRQIIHGRNLDYNLSPYLQNITFIAKFYKNNTLVFTSAHLAGFIGVITGHKQNAFTFEINERDQGTFWINALYLILDKKATPLSFLTRNLMENMTSFDAAVDLMSTSDLIAPAYFLIGGAKPNEAVVLTRNQSALVDKWRLNPNSENFDRWFLIETNYDHWTQPPANDNRRDPGIDTMNTISQAKINYETMLDVISMKPICNSGTVYSVVMSARDDAEKGFKVIIH